MTRPLVRRLAQGSGRGLDADVCCDAPHLPPSASEIGKCYVYLDDIILFTGYTLCVHDIIMKADECRLEYYLLDQCLVVQFRYFR